MSAAELGVEPGFYIAGGTLRRDAPCYVRRQADDELYDSLRRGEFCYVLTARQMGKSSMMVRTAARLRETGNAVAVLDLTAIGQNLDAERWYYGLLSHIGQQLGLPGLPDLEGEFRTFWLEHQMLGPLQRWMKAVREVLLPLHLHDSGQVVIFIDEIDAVRSLPFSTDEFFAAIREFYNRRTEDADLQRLNFCLLGVASPSDLIRDTRMTPFNIGRRIELGDFTETEAGTLAQGLRQGARGSVRLLKRILHWTGGHPYLTQRLCLSMAEPDLHSASPPIGLDPQSVDRWCSELFLSPRARERDDNLLFVRERMLRSEVDLASLLHLYDRAHSGRRVPDDDTNPLVSTLRLSGITRVDAGRHRVRNRIYQHVFDHQWVKTNMPDAEMRRQRAAYRRGVLRATAVALVIVAAIACLALFALRERNAAEQARAEAYSRELAASAIAQLPADPELGLLLTMEGMRVGPTAQAEDALRQGLPESHVQAVLRGHTSGIPTAAFSPDSQLVGTGSFDHTARVWQASSGQIVAELRGHTGRVNRVAFSPDSRLVVTASTDRTARVWEVATGRGLVVLAQHTDGVEEAAFSPDGKLVLTGAWDNTARIWEAASGRCLAVLSGHTGAVYKAAFSPDGGLIATAGLDYTARVWEVRTGRNLKVLRGHTHNQVVSVAFSPDGQMIVSAGWDMTAQVWEVETGRRLAVLRGHKSVIRNAVFSPDSNLVATASEDGAARLWQVSTGQVVKELHGHTSKVWDARFSPDGALLVTASYDGTARIWDVGDGRTLAELRGHTRGVGCAMFSPNGQWVVTGSGDFTARVWAVSRSNLAPKLQGHTSGVFAAAFSPDGRLVATASSDGTAAVWEASTGRRLSELHANLGGAGSFLWVRDVAFSPDGKGVLTASWDGLARLWDPHTGQCVRELRGHTARLFSAAFSPNGQAAVTTSNDETARIWEVGSGRILQELRGHKGEVWDAGFSPDGKLVVTAGKEDKTVRVWETSDGRNVMVLAGHTDAVSGVAFSPDGKLIVSGSYDTTVRVWEAATGRCLKELRGHRYSVTNVAFSRDGQFVATASFDGTARVWEVSTWRTVALFRGHTNEIWSVDFSPDGKYLVLASDIARIYACEVCRPIEEVLALARTRVTRGLTQEEREKYFHEPRR